MVRLLIALGFVAALLPALASAQQPPPGYVPPDPTLFPTGGGYRLAWQPVSGATRYAIRLGVTADDGTFIADDELGNIDAGTRTFDIDAVLPHTQPNSCYAMRWRVYALIGTSAPEPPGQHSIAMCTDTDNRSFFAIVPAAPMLPRTGDGASIEPTGNGSTAALLLMPCALIVVTCTALFRHHR